MISVFLLKTNNKNKPAFTEFNAPSNYFKMSPPHCTILPALTSSILNSSWPIGGNAGDNDLSILATTFYICALGFCHSPDSLLSELWDAVLLSFFCTQVWLSERMVFFLWTHTVNILKPRRENHLSTQSLESLFMSLKSSVSLWTTHSPPRSTSSALGIFPAWFCDFRGTRHGSDLGGICANYCLIGLSWSMRGPGAVQIKYGRVREVVGSGQLAGDVSLSVCEVLVYWIRQDNYHKWPVGTVWGPRRL